MIIIVKNIITFYRTYFRNNMMDHFFFFIYLQTIKKIYCFFIFINKDKILTENKYINLYRC